MIILLISNNGRANKKVILFLDAFCQIILLTIWLFSALSSPLYQNVDALKSSPNYPYVDDLPLPPLPPSDSFGSSSTSWANRPMDNLKFPPPPPEVEDYSYASDINGNQFRYENTIDRKSQENLYSNLHPQPSLVSGFQFC